MAEVFPVQPDEGSGGRQRWPRLLEEYDDGTYRQYKRGGSVALGYRSLQFGELSKEELDSILAFFDARMRPGGDTEFSIYDFKEANSIDVSGMDTVGLRKAMFLDDQIEWTMDGPCSFSCNVNIKLLD
ncbi:MAG: hypothetical protein AABN33_18470 [Acidobacteriota bacterium]